MDDTRSRIRRQRSLSPTRELAETTPLHGGNRRSSFYAIGSFLVPSMFQIKVHDRSATAKKKFQVNVPTKMLCILGLIFLLMPISVFWYKEKHIHEDHHNPHFRQQKFVNVDQKQALAHFKENQNNETSDMTSRDDPPESNKNQQLKAADMTNATDVAEDRNAVKYEDNATATNGEDEGPQSR